MSEFPVEALDEIVYKIQEGLGKANGLDRGWMNHTGRLGLIATIDKDILERLLVVRNDLIASVCDLRQYIRKMCLDLNRLFYETYAHKRTKEDVETREGLIFDAKVKIANLEKIYFKLVPKDWRMPMDMPEPKSHENGS